MGQCVTLLNDKRFYLMLVQIIVHWYRSWYILTDRGTLVQIVVQRYRSDSGHIAGDRLDRLLVFTDTQSS